MLQDIQASTLALRVEGPGSGFIRLSKVLGWYGFRHGGKGIRTPSVLDLGSVRFGDQG